MMMGHDPGLAARPPARNNLEVGGDWYSPFRVSAVDKPFAPRRRAADPWIAIDIPLSPSRLRGNLGAVDLYL
jgi:hypothetical protein